MRTNNVDVMERFIKGETNVQSHNGNLFIDQVGSNNGQGGTHQLVNYYTPIAKLEGNKVIMTTHKYSVTTSKIQSQLRGAVIRLNQIYNNKYQLVEVENEL